MLNEKFPLGPDGNPVLIEYILFRLPTFGVMLHMICRTGHELSLHDHPWTFISIILKGGYKEVTDSWTRFQPPGSILFRPAEWRHRVIIEPGKVAWTLVFAGRARRRWGYWPNGKWCWSQHYNLQLGVCDEEGKGALQPKVWK